MDMESYEENESDNINNDYIDYHRGGGFFVEDMDDESECIETLDKIDEFKYTKTLSIANLEICETNKCDKSSIKILAAERDVLKKKLNFISSIHEKFDQFRRSSKFCDITLFANDCQDIIPAHKLVLASHSSVLIEIFDTNITNQIYVNCDSNTLEIILLWMYNIVREITVNRYNFLYLLVRALEWKIQYIEDQCLNYIKQNPVDFEKYFSHFLRGFDGCFGPEDDICPFVIKYFSELPEYFMKLICEKIKNKIYIQTIISDDNLACPREDKIYDFIMKWVRHDEEDRKKYLWELIECLRLPLMSENYLSKIISEPLLSEYALTIKDRIQKFSSVIEQMQSDNLNFYTQHKDDKDYKRRIPELLGKSKVIFAVRNQWEMVDASPVEYLDVIVNDYEQNIVQCWKPLAGSVFRPRNELSKLVAFENGLVFAVGGLSANNRPTCEMDMIDLTFYDQTWIPSPPMNFARSNPAVCNDDRYIYVVGGVGIDGEVPLWIEIFDTNSGSWNAVCNDVKRFYDMKLRRTNHSITCQNGVLYIIGGMDDQGNPIECIEILDTVNEQLTELYVNDYFNDSCTTLLNNSLFIIGGYYTKKKNYKISNSALVVDFDGHVFRFRRSKCLAVEREKASVVAIDDDLYVFGGLNSKQEPVLETEILYFYSKHFGRSVSGMTAKFIDQNVIVLPKKLLEYTKILLNENE